MGNHNGLRLKKLYTAFYEFLSEKWIETDVPGTRLHRFAHFWLLVYKSFSRNRCPLRATALAYTTLLALVPLLALSVSITTSLLKERGENSARDLIARFVDAAVPQLSLMPAESETAPDPRQQVVDSIYSFINNMQVGTLGLTGVLGLLLVGILLLSTIEDTFNDIWGVTRGRSWWRRIVHYWTAISLGPIVLALVVAHVGSTFLQPGKAELGSVAFTLQLVPSFLIVSLAFALLYKLMPNTVVSLPAAMIGGVVGGSAWLLLNILNAMNLSRVVSMSKIYGTALALVPIFLIGLYFSWMIVLFGAQVCYAYQNRQVYVQEKKAESVNQRGREYVALRVMTLLSHHFERGNKPLTLLEIATTLGVPSRLITVVLQPMLDCGLVTETSGTQAGFMPARPLEKITCHDVLQALRTGGGLELDTSDDGSRQVVCAEFEQIARAEQQAASTMTLKELVQRVSESEGESSTPQIILPRESRG